MAKIYLKRVKEKYLQYCEWGWGNGRSCYFGHVSQCKRPRQLPPCGGGFCFRLATKCEIAAWKKKHESIRR